MRKGLAIGVWCLVLGLVGPAPLAFGAETNVIDGVTYVCEDGLCRMVPSDDAQPAAPTNPQPSNFRIAQGYMDADAFVAFLENRPPASPLADKRWWLILLLTVLGGLAMNLTPCVLPLIPVNLIVIGRSARRGTAYGLGMALAYGALGVAAALGGLAFGEIQGSPWFNLVVAVVFLLLALSLFGVYALDLARFRPTQKRANSQTQTLLLPFFLGALSAVLAGACVAPILVSVLLLTGNLFAEGHVFALALPFALGLGMALPWPFLGAGLKVLPKPGAWMKGVNRAFALLVFGFAVWYGHLAWQGFIVLDRVDGCNGRVRPLGGPPRTSAPTLISHVLHLQSTPHSKPILFDCWASWCKNCAAMERRVLPDPKVQRALERYELIRMQAENLSELRRVPGFESIRGLPAFVIWSPSEADVILFR